MLYQIYQVFFVYIGHFYLSSDDGDEFWNVDTICKKY